jgi:hypothetical protein
MDCESSLWALLFLGQPPLFSLPSLQAEGLQWGWGEASTGDTWVPGLHPGV